MLYLSWYFVWFKKLKDTAMHKFSILADVVFDIVILCWGIFACMHESNNCASKQTYTYTVYRVIIARCGEYSLSPRTMPAQQHQATQRITNRAPRHRSHRHSRARYYYCSLLIWVICECVIARFARLLCGGSSEWMLRLPNESCARPLEEMSCSRPLFFVGCRQSADRACICAVNWKRDRVWYWVVVISVGEENSRFLGLVRTLYKIICGVAIVNFWISENHVFFMFTFNF